jgi:hypothetical protein
MDETIHSVWAIVSLSNRHATTIASNYVPRVNHARFSEYITALENSDYDDYLEKNLPTLTRQHVEFQRCLREEVEEVEFNVLWGFRSFRSPYGDLSRALRISISFAPQAGSFYISMIPRRQSGSLEGSATGRDQVKRSEYGRKVT